MKLIQENLSKIQDWERIEVVLPRYDVEAMVKKTCKRPTWVHFGAGNIFRGFVASLQQRLLNNGSVTRGIIAVEPFDDLIIPKIYTPCDNLSLNITVDTSGTCTREIIGSIAESVQGSELQRLREIFTCRSLQMVTLTITEKGYGLKSSDGTYLPMVEADFEDGVEQPKHTITLLASLLYVRYQSGRRPISVVSLDNCAKNGKKLRLAVLDIVKNWVKREKVPEDFLKYVKSQRKVAFPWTMVDKIIPHPSQGVLEDLRGLGLEDMNILYTATGTVTAPFVNGERTQHLVVEDRFPNGRPPLEEAGVHFVSRAVVNQAETMKVSTCLNPLHTALGIYGSLLGIESIADCMKDVRLLKLVKTLGFTEGMPVVVNPEIIDPQVFLDEVITKRLPNSFLPDQPGRIATDTSQKIGARFGVTLKAYVEQGLDVGQLVGIPLVIAGWLRYLLAVDDQLEEMVCSPDPLLEFLQEALSGIEVGKPETYQGQLQEILSLRSLFGVNLTEIGLTSLIEEMFVDQLSGENAVSRCLNHYL